VPANILLNAAQREVLSHKNRLNVAALSKANFQCDRAALPQILPGMPGNDSVGIQSVLSAIQSLDRIMQRYFTLQTLYIGGWYVRRIGNNQVE